MAMTATATFRTSPELKARIEFLSRETRRPASFYYNLLLEDYLDELEDVYLSEKVLEEIRAGKQKSIPADEVYRELGI